METLESMQVRWSAARDARRSLFAEVLREGGSIRQMGRLWPLCSPFLPEWNTPEHLAKHIEAREHGMGLKCDVLRVVADGAVTA